jgi:hypothetical protein
MEAYWGSGGIAPRTARFTFTEKAAGTHSIGGWVDPRAGQDTVVNRKISNTFQDLNPRLSNP